MKIKFLCAAAAVATAFASTAAFAEDAAPASDFTITGTAAIASQYRFRGISQSDNKPVVQGSITVAHKSGFYVSTWASSASAGNSAVNIGGTEIDVYGGYTAPIAKTGLTFDGGLYGYLYPGSAAVAGGISGNYYELYASLTKALGPVSLKAGINFAPKQAYFNDFKTPSKSNAYKYVEATYAVPETALTLHAHVAHSAGGFNWTKEYVDYTVGAGYKIKSITLDASLVGTNVSKTDAGGANEVYRAGKPVGVLSLTAAF
jgi:uncharacterized protein (TIGR02001 family)